MKTKTIFMLAAMLLMSMGAFAQSNEPLEGDVNNDGKVDVADIVKIIDIMQNSETPVEETKYYWYFGTTKLTTDEEIKANGTGISSKDEIPNSLNLVDPEETLFYYFYWPKSFGTPTLTFNGLPASGKPVEELSNMQLTDYTGWRFSKGSTGEHNITW